jgi:hypothetical protein
MKRSLRMVLFTAVPLLLARGAAAHHSHAMFDMSRSLEVTGTAAKFEWSNPHIFLWVYVPDSKQPSGYQLYAFESGALVAMARVGWDRDAVRAGEKLTVDYMPLKDGRPGGVLLKVTRANGKALTGDPLTLQASKGLLKAGK